MRLFDFLKKGKSQKPVTAQPAPAAKQESTLPTATVKQPLAIKRFSVEDIEKIVCGFIDENGLNGLTKEEAELAKPFFTSLFFYFHENATKNSTLTRCDRNGCALNQSAPVFATASKALCCDCALQYILGNLSNWHYYLGNLASGIGSVSANMQTKGKELQAQISQLRQQNLAEQLSEMTDEEIYQIVADGDSDIDMRAEAVLKIKDVELVNKIALEATAYPILLSVLEFSLPRETVVHVSNQTHNTLWANKVRAKALKKLEEIDRELLG